MLILKIKELNAFPNINVKFPLLWLNLFSQN